MLRRFQVVAALAGATWKRERVGDFEVGATDAGKVVAVRTSDFVDYAEVAKLPEFS